MPVTCGYVEREEQRDIQCGEVAGPGGYCARHGGMVAASSLTLDDVAKALGDDATLHVERRPGGSWNAEVNYMDEIIGDGGPTLAEAVAAALADLAVQRRRAPFASARYEAAEVCVAAARAVLAGEKGEGQEAAARVCAAVERAARAAGAR